MRINRSVRPITSSVIIYSLIFSLLSFSVTSASAAQQPTVELISLESETQVLHAEGLVGPPSALQQAPLDAATLNWLNSMPEGSTRRIVAEMVIETVQETGSRITVVGSWVNQAKKYADPLLDGGTSDHDMRHVMEGATEAEAVAQWKVVRSRLISKIRANPRLAGNAQKVLQSINLYPPDVILDGISEPADAVKKLNDLHMNPNLADGPVEGFWGDGGKTFRNAYETKYGRALWVSRVTKDGRAISQIASGLADLPPYGGNVDIIYTASGTANIASQAVDKVDDALKKYDTRTFRKQLERLRDSLKKSRDLSRVGKTSYVESLIEELDGCCRVKNAEGKWVDDPAKIKSMLIDPSNRARIDAMLRKAKMDAELLRQLSFSSHPRDIELFKNMLEEGTSRWARVRNALSEASAHVPWGPLFKAFIAFMIYIQVKDTWTNYQAGENERIFRNLLADASFFASIPAGILTLVVNSIIEDAKAAGYIFVTRYQDCEDLIAGIYEVKGREKVSDQQKIETSIEQLATTYTEPSEVLEVVATHAHEASKRDNTGKVTEKVDAKIEEELNKKCGPVILDRWQKRRIEMIGAAAEKLRAALDEIDRTDAGGIATPDPAQLKDGKAIVDARANFPLDNASVSRKLQEFVDTIKPLGGKDKLVAVNLRTGYRWIQDEVQLSLDEQDHNSARPIFDNTMATKRLEFASEGVHSARLQFVLEVDVTTIASDVLAAKSMLDMSVAKSIPFIINVESDASPTPTPTATPKTSPTPSPSPGVSPTPSDDSKVEFGGNVPGIWDGGKNPQGFNFKRAPAKTKVAGECQWEGVVNADIFGQIDDWRAPRAEELDREIQSITASNKAWGKTTKVRDITIGGFKGKMVDSSIAWYYGSWSDAGYRGESISASGRGWLYRGRHVVTVGYNIGGGGCWTNVHRAFLTSMAAAAQAEAIAIINGLTLVEKGDFTKSPYTGPKLDGSDLPKVVLSPPSFEKLKVGDTVKVTAMVEGAKPEDSPFTYDWGGTFDGKPETSKQLATITIKPTKAGKFPLSAGVNGARSFLGTASLEYEVADYKVEIKQDSPTTRKFAVGTPVTFSARLTSGGAPATGNFIFRWQPTPEVDFEPIEGTKNNSTATFNRPEVTKVWVQVLEKKGEILTPIAESAQIEVEAVKPELTIKFVPEKVFIGQEVKAIVEVTPAELKDIDFRWEIAPNARQTLQSQNAREVTIVPQNDQPVAVTVRARVPIKGDDLGDKTATITADKYDVKVAVLGAEGPKPQVWREGVGLVTLEKEIAVHQFVGMRAEVTPQADGLRYEWNLNEDSHFGGNSLTQQVRLYRSQTGMCEATVVVRDKNGLELGRASGTFSASVTQDALETAKTKGGTIEKLKNAKDLVAKGQLDGGIDLIETVVKSDPTNTEARDLATKWRNERRIIIDQIAKAKAFIENQRFEDASMELTVAKNLHNLYPPILAVENELNEKAKSFESGVNNAIFAIKAAVDERDYKKALQLCGEIRTKLKLLPQTEQTVKGYEDFARSHEAEKERIRAVLKQGEAKYQNSDYDGALANFAQLWVNFNTYWNAAIDPEPRYYENLRNEALRRRDRINTLLPEIKQALEAPTFDRRRLEAANTLVNEVLQLQPGNTNVLGYRTAIAEKLAKGDTNAQFNEAIKLGDQLARERKWAEAVKAYDQAVRSDPLNANAYRLRGRAKREAGDFNGAIKDFTKSLELDPSDHQTWVGRGLTKVKLGDKSGAMTDYDRGIGLKPDYAAGYGSRAALKLDNADFKGAIADYDRALTYDPNVSAYFANRAYAKAKLGDQSGAIADYTKAIELQPNSPISYNNRGHSKQQLGDLRGALADFEKALELDPNYTTAKNNIAKIKEQLGTGQTDTGIISADSKFYPINLTAVGGKTGPVRNAKNIDIDDASWIRLKSTDENRRRLQIPVPDQYFRSSQIAIVTNLDDATYLAQGDTIAVMFLTTDSGYKTFRIQAGVHSSEWNYSVGPKHKRVDNLDIGDNRFLAVFDLGGPTVVRDIRFEYVETNTQKWAGHAPGIVVRGVTLIGSGSTANGEPGLSGFASGKYRLIANRSSSIATLIVTGNTFTGDVAGHLISKGIISGNSVSFHLAAGSWAQGQDYTGTIQGNKIVGKFTGAPGPIGRDYWDWELDLTPLGAAPTPTPAPTPRPTPIPQPPADEAVIFTNTNIYGVYNQPTAATQFTIYRPHLITSIFTYHWNNARGTVRPGTITLRGSDGRTYGRWTATGSLGQGGVINAGWTVFPNVTLPAGTYTVVDSDPTTWAQNTGSRGQGHTIVKGKPGSTVIVAPTPAPTPIRTATPAPTPTRTGSKYVTAIFENRSDEAVHIFTEGESFGPGNKIAPGERREVRVLMTATGRVKFIAGRNGQVMTTKFWDGDPDNLNRFPRVAFDGRVLLITTGLR